jgi:REP element-mobilizing transposase RayT
MLRQVRIQYAGALHHGMARGDRREAIFRDEDDRRMFLSTLGDACGRTGWLCHAYVLMGNHYHMVIENAGSESGGGGGVAEKRVHPPAQCQAPALVPCVRGGC